MEKKLKIGVIFGGRSGEKEVSLNSGRHVCNTLNRKKYEILPIFWTRDGMFYRVPQSLLLQNTTQDIVERLGEAERVPYEGLSRCIDIAFLTTYGKFGEDGCLQAVMKILGIPCTSSSILSASLTMDKWMQRKIMRMNPKIRTLSDFVVEKNSYEKARGNVIAEIKKIIGFPWVVKPTREGSTLGVEIISDPKEIDSKFQIAFEFDNMILIESYLEGLEFSCVVLGENPPRALMPTETLHTDKIFSYHDKYMPGVSNKITPARVKKDKLEKIQNMACETFKTLEMSVYGRIDGFVVNQDDIYITDPNAFSGLAPSSWTFHQAAHEGWTPAQFLEKIIQLTLEKNK